MQSYVIILMTFVKTYVKYIVKIYANTVENLIEVHYNDIGECSVKFNAKI